MLCMSLQRCVVGCLFFVVDIDVWGFFGVCFWGVMVEGVTWVGFGGKLGGDLCFCFLCCACCFLYNILNLALT